MEETGENDRPVKDLCCTVHSSKIFDFFQVTSLATVIGLREESKTVKTLRLKIHDDKLTFKAGQWYISYYYNN